MDFGPVALWNSMGFLAKAVSLLLVGMSIYSLTVAVERWIVYRGAKKESLEFAKQVTQFLKQNRPQDAIAAARKYKRKLGARWHRSRRLMRTGAKHRTGGNLGSLETRTGGPKMSPRRCFGKSLRPTAARSYES